MHGVHASCVPCTHRWEDVQTFSGHRIRRPCIRALNLGAGGSVKLTRIDPAQPVTSLLVRPRPGWWSLLAYLTGVDPALVSSSQQLQQQQQLLMQQQHKKERCVCGVCLQHGAAA
jgi:hypothetical protein